MTDNIRDVPPVVCTLTRQALTERVLAWHDLAALAITAERIESGVASTYPLDLHVAIVDLAEREHDCCGSWLDAEVIVEGQHVRLELTTVNPNGLPMIRQMSGLG